MLKEILTWSSLMLLLTSLTACSARLTEDELTVPIMPPSEQESTETVTLSLTPTWSEQPQPAATSVAEPAQTMEFEIIPTTTPTPTLGIELHTDCPTLIGNTQPSIWPAGSILFYQGDIGKGALWMPLLGQESIWAITAGNLGAQQIYQRAKPATVSPDGNTLVLIEKNAEATAPVITYYSMAGGESVEVALPSLLMGESVDEWYPYSSWSPEGNLRIIVELDQSPGTGQTWEITTIDPDREIIEHSILELKLPDYEYYEYDVERERPSGFVAVDPTFQRVLYTAVDGLGNDEVRLLDLGTGEVLWRGHSSALVDISPEWSADGKTVLLKVAEPIPGTTYAWSKLVSLTRDGIEEKLPPQPYPAADGYIANYSRSPDGRYIFYSLYSYETHRLHGYVVDTETWRAADICDPATSLIGSVPFDNVEVNWLPGGQLVYRVLIEYGERPMHALRVLDIPSWTAQQILRTEPGQGVNVIGWTHLEFQSPVR